METITLYRIKNAGWTVDRKINIELFEKAYQNIGIDIPEKVKRFLEKYGMLKIRFEKISQNMKLEEVIEFNPINAIGANLDNDYFSNIFEEYDIDDIVYPIGLANRGNLLILMTENGKFYRYTNGFLCKDGDNVEEMLDCVVGECYEPMYFD